MEAPVKEAGNKVNSTVQESSQEENKVSISFGTQIGKKELGMASVSHRRKTDKFNLRSGKMARRMDTRSLFKKTVK